MSWDFKREESNNFNTRIPEGRHRVRIKSAEKAVSKTGKDMLTLQLDVSGYPDIVYHYIVFLPDNVQLTNQKLTQFFDAFKDIPEGDFNTANWVGKVGACTIKHEEYNGNVNAKVGYFIHVDKQGDLAPWVEPQRESSGSSAGGTADFMNMPADIPEAVPFA